MTDRGMHQVGFEKQGEAHDRRSGDLGRRMRSEGKWTCGQRWRYGWAVAIPVTFSK